MVLKQVMDVMELVAGPKIDIEQVKGFFESRGIDESLISFEEIKEDKGATLFVKIRVPGSYNNTRNPRKTGTAVVGDAAVGEPAPTLGIIGRLGGIGARPHETGFVSDADGAITALAAAAELGRMRAQGDALAGDVIVATHLCPNSPIIPHDPVPFMDAPVSMATMNAKEVDGAMDAILAIDATKGNRVINHRGFAISPTIKDGYILRVSEDLLDIMQNVTGKMPVVFPVTTQDITPYGNGVFHLNSILQPATATSAPVVGVALTAEIPVPGCATGANQWADIEAAARFVVETAKAFTADRCAFYDADEFERLQSLYGSQKHFQTLGKS
jgi:hypothetical protein